MDKVLVDRFWNDFIIPTQDEVADIDFVNVSDIVRALVKSRNWAGTISQEAISLESQKNTLETALKRTHKRIEIIERDILSKVDSIPSFATKNKDFLRIFVLSKASVDDQSAITNLDHDAHIFEIELMNIESNLRNLETMKKALDKTSEWLTQYINWNKFELRSLER